MPDYSLSIENIEEFIDLQLARGVLMTKNTSVVYIGRFWDKLHSMTPPQGCIKEIPNITLKKISLHSMTPPSEQIKEIIP